MSRFEKERKRKDKEEKKEPTQKPTREFKKIDSKKSKIPKTKVSSNLTPKTPSRSQKKEELKLLFSTKECYEGTWGEKKTALGKEKNYNSMNDFLKKKGLVLEWDIKDTPIPKIALEGRVPIQTKDEIESEGFYNQMKSRLKINLPSVSKNPVLMPKAEVIPADPIDINDEVLPLFNEKGLKRVLKNKLSNVILFGDGRSIPKNFESIMAAPKIDDSMYIPLRRISLDYVLPGIGDIEKNTVFLLEENRRFIEAYMVGLNHEMNRELVWREFPTDRRGTVFSHFWDPVRLEEDDDGNEAPPRDIDEIHTWSKKLGENLVNNAPQGVETTSANIVLVIKGDVIRRYPDIIIYAIKRQLITKPEDFSDDYDDVSNVLIQPIFRANLGPDILVIGFPITKDDLDFSGGQDNYYFVLQEQQDLPVFGFDVSGEDESWEDIEERELLRNNYIEDFSTIFGENIEDINSATIALNTYQVPVRVVIHAKALLEGILTHNN